MRLTVSLLAALTAASLSGQNADPAGKPARAAGRVIGEVAAVDENSRKLSIKADAGGVYDVLMDAGTSFRKVPLGAKDTSGATPTKLGEMHAGDRIIARGAVSESDKTITATSIIVMTKAELAKKAEIEKAEWQKRGIVGTVSAVDAAAKTVTVKVSNRGEKKDVIVDASGNVNLRKYAADSTRFADSTAAALTDIQTGDQARALGEKDADGTHLKAEAIVFGTFHNIAAQVTGVDAASNEIRVKDLDTKKPVSIKVTGESVLRRLPEQFAQMMAMRIQRQAAGGQGGPGGAGAPGGQAGAGGAAGMRPGGFAGMGQGGPGGGFGGRGGGPPDIQQMIERMPALTLAELKSGDALIVLTTAGTEGKVTAITMLAGVEPILTAAPRDRGQTLGGAWNLGGDAGIPVQ